MKKINYIVLVFMFAVQVPIANAVDSGKLNGFYDISGINTIDPHPDEPKDSHYYVNLHGDGAKALYMYENESS